MSRLTFASLCVTLLACGSSTETAPVAQAGSGGALLTGANASTAGAGGANTSTTSSTDEGVGAGSGAGGSGAGGGQGDAGPLMCSGLTGAIGDSKIMVQSSSGMREVLVHVPKSYDKALQTMLVLTFHGLTETDQNIEDITEMDIKSDAHGFVVAYPQGDAFSWNAGNCCGIAQTNGDDDVGFVRNLIDALAKLYCVDPKRVFATGFSNGGMLSHRLACELSDRIAAIGAVSGTIEVDTCAPPRTVPVLHVHGTGDFVVPFNGGGLGGTTSVPDTINGWVKRDGCTDAQPVQTYSQGDATCNAYVQCKAGGTVELCTIQDGGHEWPGGLSAGPAGKLSTDLDASEHIIEFFTKHPMP